MSDLEKKLEEVILEQNDVVSRLKELRESEIVQEFLELQRKNEELKGNYQKLSLEKKGQEYDSCSHIWVSSEVVSDRFEERAHSYCGCIKCGLNKSVLRQDRNYLSLEQKAMYDYCKDRRVFPGLESKVVCNLDLAKAIYARIKENIPDIDDARALDYFEAALHDIRAIKVSSERRKNRAKRLSLEKNFNKWSSLDCHVD